jgi:AraC-like DNA-binding protein
VEQAIGTIIASAITALRVLVIAFTLPRVDEAGAWSIHARGWDSLRRMRLPPRIPGTGAGALPAWPPVHTARGPGGISGAHAHHAMHLVLSHGGQIHVDVDRERHDVPGVLTAPDAKHAIDARGSEVTLVFLDPESGAGERLRATIHGAARLLTAAERDVRKLLRHLSSLPSSADTSLEALAAVAGLSPGRLMHVFTESVGIPLRPYLGWLRFQRAAAAIASGVSLSQAAAIAGFVDAAHMTRSFRAMFGTTPSSLRDRNGLSQR